MNTLYTITLFLHSWNRWIILVAGFLVLLAAIRGLTSNTEYTSSQRKWSLIFISSLHLQLLVGLAMYFFISPITAQALNDFGAAMKDSTLRFWAVEHAFVNILAVAFAQTGSILAKKAKTAAAKHKRMLIWTAIAFILILAMIPMGMMGVDRPWFRF